MPYLTRLTWGRKRSGHVWASLRLSQKLLSPCVHQELAFSLCRTLSSSGRGLLAILPDWEYRPFFSLTDMMYKKRWDQIETETKRPFLSRKWRVGIRWISTITTDQRKCRLAHTLRKHQNGKAAMPEKPAVFGLVLLRVKIVGSHPRPSLTQRTAVSQTTSGPTEKGVCLRVCQ